MFLTVHLLMYSFCWSSVMLAGRTVGRPGMTDLMSSLPQRLLRFFLEGSSGSVGVCACVCVCVHMYMYIVMDGASPPRRIRSHTHKHMCNTQVLYTPGNSADAALLAASRCLFSSGSLLPPPPPPPLPPTPPTPPILTPGILTPGILPPGILTPDILTPGILTPGILTPGIPTPGIPTPGILTGKGNSGSCV